MSLLVVGALHWDVIVRAPRLPREDETLVGRDVAYRFGGKGGNQAMAARRAGGDVSFAGRIGTDDAGRQMRNALDRGRIETTSLQQGRGASGMSVAIQQDGGSYGAVIVSAENRELEIGLIPFEGVTAVLMQNELGPALLDGLLDRAARADVPVILNAAPALGLDPATLAGRVAYLVVNRVEAGDLLGAPVTDTRAAAEALAKLVRGARVVITLGGDGAVFAGAGQGARHLPARAVDVVSTHGAGDAFCGALAAALLRGDGLERAVEAGQVAAADLISLQAEDRR